MICCIFIEFRLTASEKLKCKLSVVREKLKDCKEGFVVSSVKLEVRIGTGKPTYKFELVSSTTPNWRLIYVVTFEIARLEKTFILSRSLRDK